MVKPAVPRPEQHPYGPRTTEAVKRVLVELGQVLGDYRGKFAIKGEWVGVMWASLWSLGTTAADWQSFSPFALLQPPRGCRTGRRAVKPRETAWADRSQLFFRSGNERLMACPICAPTAKQQKSRPEWCSLAC